MSVVRTRGSLYPECKPKHLWSVKIRLDKPVGTYSPVGPYWKTLRGIIDASKPKTAMNLDQIVKKNPNVRAFKISIICVLCSLFYLSQTRFFIDYRRLVYILLADSKVLQTWTNGQVKFFYFPSALFQNALVVSHRPCEFFYSEIAYGEFVLQPSRFIRNFLFVNNCRWQLTFKPITGAESSSAEYLIFRF